MTIAFLTLFFGLITGPVPVELSVQEPVAAVEILLDGQRVGRLDGPPWKTQIDFGRELLPREVVARALDAEGREIGRARALANVPNSLTKVEILLEGAPGAAPKAAQVVWKHLKGTKPRYVSLIFDGLPVKLDKNSRAVLPSHSLKTLHVLTAEIKFSSTEILRKDVAYGGEYGSEVSTELTAVPVRVRGGELPKAEELSGWFTAAGQPLTATAVENGPGELYVIRSPTAQATAKSLFLRLLADPQKRRRSLSAAETRRIRQAMKLGDEDNFLFVFPIPQRFRAAGERSDLFEISPSIPATEGGLPYLVMSSSRRVPGDAGQQTSGVRLADAAAVSGLAATAQSRRRAVLLLLTGEPDESAFDSARVRRFLAAIRVPLIVWYLDPPDGRSLAAWGPGEVISDRTSLERAVNNLRAELDSQRIVFVDGSHLPQSIALTPAARQVELVGLP